MKSFLLALVTLASTAFAMPAAALELSSRRLEVSGQIDAKAGAKLASDLMRLNESGPEPIYLLVTANGGTAQGVMIVADAIKALESPVVAIVLTPIQGAGATLPFFADRVVMLPSAQLVLTEVDYEGVAKPPVPALPVTPETKPPSKADTFLQKVRTDYLVKFWAAVAKRIGGSGPALQAEMEQQGGRVISADEALKSKIAFEIVSSLESPRTANEKIETKSTTTRTITKTVPKSATPPGVN